MLVSVNSDLYAACSHVRCCARSLIIYLIIIFALLIACAKTRISHIIILLVFRFHKHIETTMWIWLPSTCSRHWKVIYQSSIVFPSCHHIPNTILICFTTTKLRNLAIWHKAFVKFMMLYCAFNVPCKLPWLITDARLLQTSPHQGSIHGLILLIMPIRISLLHLLL